MSMVDEYTSRSARRVNRLAVASAIAGLVAGGTTSFAATRTWNNTGTDFNAAGSWDTGVPVAGDTAAFSGPADISHQPQVTSAATLANVSFLGANGFSYTLSSTGAALTLTAANAIRNEAQTGMNTVSAPIILGGALNSAQSFSLGGGSGAGLVVSGDISDNGNNILLDVSRINASWVLVLSGNNTYTGGTRINNSSGQIRLNSATALGTGALTFSAGNSQSIDNTSGAAITLTNNNSIRLNSSDISFTGSNDLSFGSGQVVMNNGSRQISVAANKLSVGGVTEDVGGRVFTKAGNGTLEISGASSHSGGTTLVAGTLLLGNKASLGSGTLALNGGTVAASANLSGANAIANGGTIGGNIAFGGSNNIEITGAFTSAASRTITNNISGGSLTLGGLTVGAGTTSAFTVTLSGTGNTTISNGIADGGTNPPTTATKLIYNGSGVLTLGGASAYTGTTTVSSGTLLVNGSLHAASTVSVTGATLGGTGTINGSVTLTNAAAILSPGASIESLDVGGNVNLGAGTLTIEYDGAASPAIDVLNVAGALTIGTAKLDLNQLGAGPSHGLNPSLVYVLASYGTLSGSAFASVLDLPATHTIEYSYTGNKIALVPVPEPTTMAFLGLASLGLLSRRRSRACGKTCRVVSR